MAELDLSNPWAIVYLLLVVAAAAGLLVAMLRIARRPAAPPAEPTAPPAEAPAPVADPEGRSLKEILAGGAPAEPWMAQFVHAPSGDRVGETIGVAEDRLVTKHEGRFRAIPLGKVRVRQGKLVAEDVDWEDAERAGEAWRAAGHRAIRYDASGMPVPDEGEPR